MKKMFNFVKFIIKEDKRLKRLCDFHMLSFHFELGVYVYMNDLTDVYN
jgi:hypothetical protein